MLPEKDRIRLLHIRDHAREAVAIASLRARQDLDSDRLLNLALVRLLEIVGEAAARITEPTKKIVPTIPWSSIVGLRNRLIHGYDDVDFDVLWVIVREDLPLLVRELDAILPGGQPPLS